MSISYDKKVRVKNLCGWDLYFHNIESNGDTRIPANGERRLSFAEIQAQINDGNKQFAGFDGLGSHAKVFIDDAEARQELGFENQSILDEETVKKVIEYKTQSTFEKHVKEKVKTNAEKNFMIRQAAKLKLNDYAKIKFLEEYTGLKYDV